MLNISLKKVSSIVAILVIIILSWVGFLDDLVAEWIDKSIIQTGVTYAATRGVNAIVSVLQTTAFSAGVAVGGQIEVGQILDPLNDMIERFADVVFIAFGSLVLQKVLLLIVSNTFFTILLTISGFALIFSFFKFTKYKSYTTKIFLILVFIRISLSVVIFANDIISDIFINNKIDNKTNKLEELRVELAANKTVNVLELQQNKDNLVNTISQTNIQLAKLKKDEKKLNIYINSLEQEQDNCDDNNCNIANKNIKDIKIKQLQENSILLVNKIKKLEQEEKICDDNDCPNEDYLENLIDEKEKELSLTKDKLDNIFDNIIKKSENNKDNIENIIEKLTDENEDRKDKLSDIKSTLNGDFSPTDIITSPLDFMTRLGQDFKAATKNIIELLVLFLLKTILVPILFYYGFIKGIRFIWNISNKKEFKKMPLNLS